MDIDFIITWVDGNDPAWQQKRSHYKGTDYQTNAVRYRDWDLLRYWFRGVEQCAPWVHRIFFVTDNQKPAWLNTNHPKLRLTDHRDYIPEKYLPTFNSNAIELNMHRLADLSEHFVSFNDDMFLKEPVGPDYYFHDGLPCDGTYEHVFDGRGYSRTDKWAISLTEYCNTQVLNAHFNRKKVVAANRKGWNGFYLGPKYQIQGLLINVRSEFQHFFTPHNEKASLKSVYKEVWDAEPELMDQSCTRFRHELNLNLYLMRLWQLASNRFYPRNVLKHRHVLQLTGGEGNLQEVEKWLFDPNCISLCLNDSIDCTQERFEQMQPELVNLMERKFPKKSSFEL